VSTVTQRNDDRKKRTSHEKKGDEHHALPGWYGSDMKQGGETNTCLRGEKGRKGSKPQDLMRKRTPER